MKKLYESPEVQVINLASMQSIALLQGRNAEDEYEGGDTSFGTGDRDF